MRSRTGRHALACFAAPAAVLAGALAGLGCSDGDDAAELDPTIEPPREIVLDLDESEPAAVRLEQDLVGLFLEPLSRGDIEGATEALAPEFVGESFTADPPEPAGDLEIQWLAASGEIFRGGPEFVAALHGLAPLSGTPERVECELIGFALAKDRSRATGRVRMRWAGRASDERVDLTLYLEIEARQAGGGDWQIVRARPDVSGQEGEGVRLTGGEPRFVDRTREVGLTFGMSDENLDHIQTFMDRQIALSLGGLSVCDWNRDGYPDLVATKAKQQAEIFLNDGHGGFVPGAFPIDEPADAPAFALYIDLDGDGLEEIVASRVSRYEGAFGYAGLWTRTGAQEGEWRHLPRAFAMPNPVGLRRLDAHVVTPIDFDDDGDFDLFFGVYGSAESRGARFNTVESYDGADNHFFENVGGLEFVERSEELGITGTGYTFIGFAFDADRDGDTDLFEGNDFGPNVLWRNDGGRFTADEGSGLGGVSSYTMGVALADLEADGRWDMYISNMSSEEGMRVAPLAVGIPDDLKSAVATLARGNMLYRQADEDSGDRGWSEHGAVLGVNEGEWAWGCHFLDVENDGALGLVVTNGYTSHRNRAAGDWQTYYWRQVVGDAHALMEERLAVNVNEGVPFQGSFNGYERDRFFVRADEGAPDRRWVDAAWLMGVDDDHDGRAVVPIDADGDGDLDLVYSALRGLTYKENTGGGDADDWVRLSLRAADAPELALGTRVVFETRGKRFARRVGLVEGFDSQVLPIVHCGFGTVTGAPIERVELHWPSGAVEVLEDLDVRKLHLVREGRGVVSSDDVPRWSPPASEPRDPHWAQNLAKIARPPAAFGRSENVLVVRVHAGPPPVAPLVSSANGARGEDWNDVRVVDAFLEGSGEGVTGLDGRDTVFLSPELFADALGNADGSATAVYDGQGRLYRLFRRDASLDEVAAFVELARVEPPYRHLLIESGRLALQESRYREAASLLTEATEHAATLRKEHAPAFEGLGRAYVLLGRLDLAADAYRSAVNLDPDYALGHFNLAATYSQTGKFEEALEALKEARRIEGDTRRVMGATAEALAGSGDREGAIATAEAWLANNPADGEMSGMVGLLYAQLERWEEAHSWLKKAVELEPGDERVKQALRSVEKELDDGG